MDQNGQPLEDWTTLIQRTVNAKAKARHHPASMLRDMDQRAPRGRRSAKIATSTYENTKLKDLRVEENKPKPQPSADVSRFRKKRKKDRCQRGQYSKNRDGATPATMVNVVEPGKPNRKKKRKNGRDMSLITCFNCDKKGHYSSKCLELTKN